MTIDTTVGRSGDNGTSDLVKVLTAHYRSLVAARCDKLVLQQYADLLRALKSSGSKLFQYRRTNPHVQSTTSRSSPTISKDDVINATLLDLEKIVNNPDTSRKSLEFIAIERFSVPKGSMRSFSTRQMLVDKLRTMIGNERTHEAIRSVARPENEDAKSE